MKQKLQAGTIAIVTGASSGIGKALALDLAKKYQARLVINARNQADLQNTAGAIRTAGGQAVTVDGDISNAKVMENVLTACNESFGTADILVNNAGFAKPGPMPALTTDDWRAVFEVNFFAPLALTYALLPHFLSRGSGKIINISSVAGKLAFPGSVCYAASKFALTGFSEGMAAELSRQGIDVITVCPGLVRTEFFKKNGNAQDVTAMAEEKNLSGWMLRHLLSISSEEASLEIMKACEQGGSREIVLTGPGKLLERVAGICPPAAHWFSRYVPANRQVVKD